jgi:hypothetical protein
MPDILALLDCFIPYVSTASIQQLSQIIVAILTMSGRVTMLGISSWTDKGGSYRSIQRFFASVIPWHQLFWAFFRAYLFNPETVYLLVGDESGVTKAGKESYGLDRFFSSLYGKPIPGIAFFALTLVNTQDRQSYPVMVEQRVRSETEKAEAKSKRKKAEKKTAKRKVGRPKGCATMQLSIFRMLALIAVADDPVNMARRLIRPICPRSI